MTVSFDSEHERRLNCVFDLLTSTFVPLEEVHRNFAFQLSVGTLSGGYIFQWLGKLPGVPKKTIHCLISCDVKSIKAISLK